jgi:hypothetical protein
VRWFAVLLLLVTPAWADELKRSECAALNVAIKALDGHIAIDKEGNPVTTTNQAGKTQTVTVPYTFAPGTVLKLADNEVELSKIVEDITAGVKARMAKEAPEESKVDPDSNVGRILQAEFEEDVARPCTAKITRVPIAALRIDENHIPQSVVAALMPMLER